MTATTKACCHRMFAEYVRDCPTHPLLADCPDALISLSIGGRHGIRIHDGGSSAVLIQFCPWCGREL